MDFKKRILEETTQEKIDKGFNGFGSAVKNNPGIAATIAGVGAGALYNHLTDGANDELSSTTDAIKDFKSGVADDIVGEKAVPESEMSQYISNFKNAADKEPNANWKDYFRWLPGTTSNKEAISAMNDAHFADKGQRFAEVTPEDKIVDNDGFKQDVLKPDFKATVDGYEIRPDLSNFANRQAYVNYMQDKLNISPEQIEAEIEKNPALKAKLDSLEQDQANSTRNSYINAGLAGGALLGGGHAAGSYASRKLKERQGV